MRQDSIEKGATGHVPAVAAPDSEAKFLSVFGTDNLLFSDQMMEITSRVVFLVVCMTMTRGESFLFLFFFFIDYLIVSHSSGPAGQKWL